jgi:hypothetical protein
MGPRGRSAIGGDQFWQCHKLAAGVLRRMASRYGPDILIVHGAATGAAESFATAAKGQRLKTEQHTVDFGYLGDEAMLRGAEICVIVHRSLLDCGTKDLARQALAAVVPTYLIANELAVPSRLEEGDAEVG